MATGHFLLVAAKVVVLFLGTAVALTAFRTYQQRGSLFMLHLSIAFGLVAVGSFVEGLLFEVLAWDLTTVHTVESAFVLAGLGMLAFLLRPRGGSS